MVRFGAGRRSSGAEPIFTGMFVSLMLANGLLAMCSAMTVTLVALFVIDQGLSPVVAGLTTSLYMLTAVLFRPLAGRTVDTRGRYIAIVLGSTLYCLATGLYVLALPVWLFLAARIFQGIGFSFNSTAAMTLATDIVPEKRMSEALGYIGLEGTLAQVLGPFSAITIAQSAGFETAFVVVFVLALGNVLLRLPLRTRIRTLDTRLAAARRTRVSPVPLWHRIVERHAWKPSLIMFFVMLGNASITSFLPAYAIGRGVSNPGLFFVVNGVFIALARLCASRIERRVGAIWTIGIGISLIAMTFLAIYCGGGLAVLLTAGALYGAGMGLVQPTVNVLVVLGAPREDRGMANSTLFLAKDVSQVLGGIALGVVADAVGLGSVFLVSAGTTLLAYVALYVSRHSRPLGRQRT